jgi:hypothetical protein
MAWYAAGAVCPVGVWVVGGNVERCVCDVDYTCLPSMQSAY